MKELKAAGKVRYIGVTVSRSYLYSELERVMRQEKLDFLQVNYSVLETEAEELLLPLAQDRGMAVLVNRPFSNGRYFSRVGRMRLPEWAADFDCESWAQFSLKYILAHPTITTVFTETSNPGHMEENAHASYGRMPDAAARARMRTLIDEV
jgi:diketogulonate reductase-like aldo/keto reductase